MINLVSYFLSPLDRMCMEVWEYSTEEDTSFFEYVEGKKDFAHTLHGRPAKTMSLSPPYSHIQVILLTLKMSERQFLSFSHSPPSTFTWQNLTHARAGTELNNLSKLTSSWYRTLSLSPLHTHSLSLL